MGANRRVVFQQFSHIEKRATWSVAALISLRMLGLFMIFPVLGAYIGIIPGATGETVGWAVGAYGLTQGLLQIPFGVWSDRWGRKPVLLVGLTLFILGSVVAALATNIWGIFMGRILQGGGAIDDSDEWTEDDEWADDEKKQDSDNDNEDDRGW